MLTKQEKLTRSLYNQLKKRLDSIINAHTMTSPDFLDPLFNDTVILSHIKTLKISSANKQIADSVFDYFNKVYPNSVFFNIFKERICNYLQNNSLDSSLEELFCFIALLHDQTLSMFGHIRKDERSSDMLKYLNKLNNFLSKKNIQISKEINKLEKIKQYNPYYIETYKNMIDEHSKLISKYTSIKNDLTPRKSFIKHFYTAYGKKNDVNQVVNYFMGHLSNFMLIRYNSKNTQFVEAVTSTIYSIKIGHGTSKKISLS